VEIVLVARLAERIAIAGQEIIDLRRSKRYPLADGDVHTATELHRKCLSRRRLGDHTIAYNRLTKRLECISIHVCVSAAKQKVCEGLNSMSTNLKLRPNHIGEQVTLNVAAQSGGERQIRGDVETGLVAGIALQIEFYPEVLVPVVSQRTATSVKAVPFRVWPARGKTQVAIVRSNFNLGPFLRKCQTDCREDGEQQEKGKSHFNPPVWGYCRLGNAPASGTSVRNYEPTEAKFGHKLLEVTAFSEGKSGAAIHSIQLGRDHRRHLGPCLREQKASPCECVAQGSHKSFHFVELTSSEEHVPPLTGLQWDPPASSVSTSIGPPTY